MHVEYQHRNEDTDFQRKGQGAGRNIVAGNQGCEREQCQHSGSYIKNKIRDQRSFAV